MLLYEFDDGCSVEVINEERIHIKTNNETLVFSKEGKPKFDNGLGETVIEYSGLSSDNNGIRSWAIANYDHDAHSKLHFHNKGTEDYYVISGQGVAKVDDKEIPLNPGVHLKITPLQQHQVLSTTNEGDEPLILLVKCEPSWVLEDFNVIELNEEEVYQRDGYTP